MSGDVRATVLNGKNSPDGIQLYFELDNSVKRVERRSEFLRDSGRQARR